MIITTMIDGDKLVSQNAMEDALLKQCKIYSEECNKLLDIMRSNRDRAYQMLNDTEYQLQRSRRKKKHQELLKRRKELLDILEHIDANAEKLFILKHEIKQLEMNFNTEELA